MPGFFYTIPIPAFYICAMLDYLIVGLGLSGVSVCAHLKENDRSFKVLTDGQKMASTVAGGVYNPVVLKRLTATWKGDVFLDYALPFYRRLEHELGQRFVFETSILRRFASTEEQNNWFLAADRPILSRFLSTQLQPSSNPAVDAPLGFGEVLETGRVDVPNLLNAYHTYLRDLDCVIEGTLDTEGLEIHPGHFTYDGITARRMILATGYRSQELTFFNYLPLRGNKGEVLVIEAPELRTENILKGKDFVIPLGGHLYKVGATYDPRDIAYETTEKARAKLIEQLGDLIKCSYTVVRQESGIRPTVPDRRPLLGTHPEHENLAILNGLGSRGVLLAPLLARHLYEHLENGTALWPEIDIDRYRKLYQEV